MPAGPRRSRDPSDPLSLANLHFGDRQKVDSAAVAMPSSRNRSCISMRRLSYRAVHADPVRGARPLLHRLRRSHTVCLVVQSTLPCRGGELGDGERAWRGREGERRGEGDTDLAACSARCHRAGSAERRWRRQLVKDAVGQEGDVGAVQRWRAARLSASGKCHRGGRCCRRIAAATTCGTRQGCGPSRPGGLPRRGCSA